MGYKERYKQWMEDDFFDIATRSELSALRDEKEIEDRFYRDLEFGTGGLRGVMGAGTNRMNKYTVGKATMGLGNYLLDTYGVEICKERGVVIGYDTRNNSESFGSHSGECAERYGHPSISSHICTSYSAAFFLGKILECAGRRCCDG